MNSGLFFTPASVSAGDLLLVALKMPPSRIGTYSNFAPVRFSIAGIASWLRKALGLPTSNRNCGFWLTAGSPEFSWPERPGRPSYDDRHVVTRFPSSQITWLAWSDAIALVGAIAVDEFDDVVANVRRPIRDPAGKSPAALR